jgi:C-terminal processing protease CtpA/Prc
MCVCVCVQYYTGLSDVQTCEITRKVVLLRDVPLGMTLGKDSERVGYVKLQGFSTSGMYL